MGATVVKEAARERMVMEEASGRRQRGRRQREGNSTLAATRRATVEATSAAAATTAAVRMVPVPTIAPAMKGQRGGEYVYAHASPNPLNLPTRQPYSTSGSVRGSKRSPHGSTDWQI